MPKNEVSVLIKARDLASKVVKGFENNLRSVVRTARGVVGGLGAITAAVGTAIVGLGRLTERGRDVNSVQRAFNRLSGDEGPEALNDLREQTRGLISDYELMAQANQAVTLGAVESTDQFGDLAEAAIALGRAQDVDARRSIESLVTGFGRLSNRRLDNLGIIVDQTEANEKYAARIKSTVDELSEAQKAEAFRAEGMEQLRIKMAELGGIQDETGDGVTRITTKIRNLVDQGAQLANESESVREFFLAIEQGIDNIDQKLPGVIDQLGELGTKLLDFLNISDPLTRQLKRFARSASQEEIRTRIEVEEGDLQAARQVLDNLEQRARDEGLVDEQGRRTFRATPEVASEEQLRLVENLELFRRNVEDLTFTVNFLQQKLREAGDAAGDAGGGEGGGGGLTIPEPARSGIVDPFRVTQGIGGREGAPIIPFAPSAVQGRVPSAAAPRSPGQTAQMVLGSLDTLQGEPGGLREGHLQAARGQLAELGFAQERIDEWIQDVVSGSEQVSQAGDLAISSLGAMAEAAIRGSDEMEQTVVSSFTSILQSLTRQGGPLSGIFGGFGGAIFGAVGGILSAAFSGGNDRPARVEVERFGREAERQMDDSDDRPMEVTVIIKDPITGEEQIRRTRQSIRRQEQLDGVIRIPTGG